jgi:hypothetical protein
MFNLLDKNISYILVSPERVNNTLSQNNINCEKLCSILYSKDYTIFSITGFHEGKYEKSFLAISSSTNNDELRFDAIYIMDEFEQESVIVKYLDEIVASKIFSDGSEKTLSLLVYDSNLQNKSYLYNGISFSFVENKRYFFPRKKEDLKNGMLVEYFNNNKWNQRQILNIDNEFDKLYKLLIKYEKVRIECK